MNLKDLKTPAFFRSSTLQDLAWGENQNPAYPYTGVNASILPILSELEHQFNPEKRNILANVLLHQYNGIELTSQQVNNIESLKQSNSFTVVTGQQIHPIMGPFFVWNKIISTIQTANQLGKEHTDKKFIPVFWMASEDHDFEEINHFKIRNQKITWNKNTSGPVGRIKTEELETVFSTIKTTFSTNDNVKYLLSLFEKAYLENETLTKATRFLVNELFKNEGLVIVDGDDKILKQLFIPTIKEELLNQSSFKKVSETINNFSYKVQVNPREINLFYIENNIRERIILENGTYKVNNTKLTFNKTEILDLVEKSPEKFSPNVILRPLYQETILPNLAYIGGGGEIAYWLELKNMFEEFKITFPILLLRNSVLVATEKQIKKMDKLHLSWSDLFLKNQDLTTKKTKELSNLTIDFSSQKETLKKQFEYLNAIAVKTDPTFLGAVKAQEVKQIKGLENLEKRLLKAEKRVLTDQLARITSIQNELFPNQSLQERSQNFSEFYIEHGERFFSELFKNQKPLSNEFTIIIL
jgi:bacillithiol biosynthesis cysteine-adding enzyme BshC